MRKNSSKHCLSEHSHMKIVLASQSPRRRQLMALITPQFRVQVSQVDESQVPEGYVDSMNKLISTRCELAKEIVRYNYFGLLFPEE